jgi:hypothetical protein
MIHSHRQCFYGRVMFGYRMFSWRLTASNRADAEHLIKPALECRRRVGEAARSWRECVVGSPEAKKAATALWSEQLRFRDALLAIGAKRANGWAHAVNELEKLPFDEGGKPTPEGSTKWFAELMRKYPERPPGLLETVEGRPGLIAEAARRFNLSLREARRCYERAKYDSKNKTWSTSHRGKARKIAS